MPHSEASADPPDDTSTNIPECVSPTSYLGLTNTVSPQPIPKSVSISNQQEIISPLILGGQKNVDDLELDGAKSYRRVPLASKRLSGRLSRTCSPVIRPSSNRARPQSEVDEKESPSLSQHQPSHRHLDQLIDQVTDWIKHERTKRAERKQKHGKKSASKLDSPSDATPTVKADASSKRRGSDASDSSFDLDQLEGILKANLNFGRRPSRKISSATLRHKSSVSSVSRKLSVASSDTEYFDNEIHVPSSDVVLDNSKTLSYAGGGGVSDESDLSSDDELHRSASRRDIDAWAIFKFEIVRLTHTLRLKGWRRVPMENSREITVQRLSGALTNAVYVVSPPSNLPSRSGHHDNVEGSHSHRKPPPKLLLRIYGPQVEHLIDRDVELGILRRLAKKRIGPRMLGTFANGRFEEYFYARPLSPEDLRNPDTSRQIAKRMRELHDGVELLDEERGGGPFVFRNWDKWVNLVEKIVSWLDGQVMGLQPGEKPSGRQAWKRRGFICGVPWPQFRAAVEKYRRWLETQYGNKAKIRDQLVFAHNDTQYGNILRLMPTGDSPLLLPANTHKQLVVIDFEYANANTPGLEFANHFTEWCYDYHDAKKPYAFHPNRYPTPEEQDRFIRAYVRHRPQYNISTPKLDPTNTPFLPGPMTETPSKARLTSNIGDYIADARAPAAMSSSPGLPCNDEALAAAEKAAKATEDRRVARLLHETRLWRLANTAQWVAWGLVQAKVPGMPRFDAEESNIATDEDFDARKGLEERAEGYRELAAVQEEGEASSSGAKAGDEAGDNDNVALQDDPTLSAAVSAQNGAPELEGEEAEDEFDYLGYARHRALFFWADAIEMGVVEADTLPRELLENLKRVSR